MAVFLLTFLHFLVLSVRCHVPTLKGRAPCPTPPLLGGVLGPASPLEMWVEVREHQFHAVCSIFSCCVLMSWLLLGLLPLQAWIVE